MASGKRRRLYSYEYNKYGFTSININTIEHPQCVICLQTLSADSMKPSLLNRHWKHVMLNLKTKIPRIFNEKKVV